MVWLKIDPHSPVPIYLQLVEEVKKAVAYGALTAGDQLPSVRELSVQLTLNPNTVARAYQELERLGVVVTQRGRGTFVAPEAADQARQEQKRRVAQLVRRLVEESRCLGLGDEELRRLVEMELTAQRPPREVPGDGRQEEGLAGKQRGGEGA